MENVKAILLANTDIENLAVENFYDSQEEVHNPMMYFKESTNEVIKHFNIAADRMEDLKLMFKHKYFDTPDLPEGEYITFAGGYFIGVGAKKEEKPSIDVKGFTAKIKERTRQLYDLHKNN